MTLLKYFSILVVGLIIGWSFAKRQSPEIVLPVVQTPLQSLPTPTAISSVQVQKPQASTLAQKPVQAEHSNLDALVKNFWSELNNNELPKAKALVDEIGQISKDSKEYNEAITRFLIRSGDSESAVPALNHCLELYPKSKSCLTDLSSIEMQVGTRDEQLKAAQNCLAIFPESPHCLNDLAIGRMHEGHFPKAVSIYEELMKSNGSYGFRFNIEMLHAQLGYALEGAGRISEAAEQFDTACRSHWQGACAKLEDLRQKF